MGEEKAKVFEMVDGKLKVNFKKEIDPNKDGEPLAGVELSVYVDVAELPDEAIAIWKAKKEK